MYSSHNEYSNNAITNNFVVSKQGNIFAAVKSLCPALIYLTFDWPTFITPPAPNSAPLLGLAEDDSALPL